MLDRSTNPAQTLLSIAKKGRSNNFSLEICLKFKYTLAYMSVSSFSLKFFWILLLIFLINVHIRGIIVYDEGQIVNHAQRIIDGNIPYRDFQFFYTPGTILLLASVFKIFGSSFIVERIVSLFLSIGSSILIYKITNYISKKTFLSVASVAIFALWGPSVINFFWPVMGCVFLGLLNIWFIVKYLETKSDKYLLLAGSAASLVLLFKQNFGAGLLVSNILGLIFISNTSRVRTFVKFGIGYLIPVLLLVYYLSLNQALGDFIFETYNITFIKILREGMLSTSFIYPDIWYREAGRLFFYILPLILAILSLFHVFKKTRKLVFISLFPLFFYLSGIRPTTDFVHLAPLMSISGISLAMLYKRYKKIVFLIFSFVTILGAYSILNKGYYRWEAPIFSHNQLYKDPKVNLLLDSKYTKALNTILPILKNSKSDYIFVYHYAPAFYFLSGKKNPTRYDNLPPEIMDAQVQRYIIARLKASKAPLVFSDKPLGRDDSLFAKYIQERFHLEEKNPDYEIWFRKNLYLVK